MPGGGCAFVNIPMTAKRAAARAAVKNKP